MKECRYCGKPFEPKNGVQVYCSYECSHAAIRERIRVGPKQKVCIVCAKDFVPELGHHTQKYCSPECRYKGRLAKNNEYNRRPASLGPQPPVLCVLCGTRPVWAKRAIYCADCRRKKDIEGAVLAERKRRYQRAIYLGIDDDL